MANFCSRCGQPVADGEICSCMKQAAGFNLDSAKGFMESMKNRMGIGDPELNKGDAFEKDKLIIPDCVKANEGETPIKQYKVATLRNRILGIPYSKAIGRMQVTNKRVIFRAPGRCLAGRTTLQHEFAIDELAGIEARREYVFNLWDLLIGYIVAFIGGSIVTSVINALCSALPQDMMIGVITVLSLLVGVAGCIPFFMLKKKWMLKLLCLGGSLLSLFTNGSLAVSTGERFDDVLTMLSGYVLNFLGVITLIITLFALIIYAIKPNLVLLVKTKSASEAISIKRKKVTLFGGKDEENTGYTEIIPAEDTERCIREINAMISDIQKLGDFGIEKWKE